ncbi:hypothetical protein HYH02_011332 [Chlamydomonas schloesseri]|uniref:HNH nuclease domain-containing protein n=1 Tax=Chlamydomonas schloesseri TaxID=2026947 RepID=A0A835T6G8_9CHLO|nr:hypothetical protein HYH02_011332 [Chlamydomonas schloesseri]|eukprot:KAG2437073.1 hypothetical protein HYH02_011332 [Chlamydomonas schloesseri]
MYRPAALQHYTGEQQPQYATCAVSRVRLPVQDVVAGHIYQKRWPLTKKVKINNPSNILLMHRNIEQQFANFWFTIHPVELKVVVLCKESADKVLFEYTDDSGQKKSVKLGDLDGRLLAIADGKAPSQYALQQHAVSAIKYALLLKWCKKVDLPHSVRCDRTVFLGFLRDSVSCSSGGSSGSSGGSSGGGSSGGSDGGSSPVTNCSGGNHDSSGGAAGGAAGPLQPRAAAQQQTPKKSAPVTAAAGARHGKRAEHMDADHSDEEEVEEEEDAPPVCARSGGGAAEHMDADHSDEEEVEEEEDAPPVCARSGGGAADSMVADHSDKEEDAPPVRGGAAGGAAGPSQPRAAAQQQTPKKSVPVTAAAGARHGKRAGEAALLQALFTGVQFEDSYNADALNNSYRSSMGPMYALLAQIGRSRPAALTVVAAAVAMLADVLAYGGSAKPALAAKREALLTKHADKRATYLSRSSSSSSAAASTAILHLNQVAELERIMTRVASVDAARQGLDALAEEATKLSARAAAAMVAAARKAAEDSCVMSMRAADVYAARCEEEEREGAVGEPGTAQQADDSEAAGAAGSKLDGGVEAVAAAAEATAEQQLQSCKEALDSRSLADHAILWQAVKQAHLVAPGRTAALRSAARQAASLQARSPIAAALVAGTVGGGAATGGNSGLQLLEAVAEPSSRARAPQQPGEMPLSFDIEGAFAAAGDTAESAAGAAAGSAAADAADEVGLQQAAEELAADALSLLSRALHVLQRVFDCQREAATKVLLFRLHDLRGHASVPVARVPCTAMSQSDMRKLVQHLERYIQQELRGSGAVLVQAYDGESSLLRTGDDPCRPTTLKQLGQLSCTCLVDGGSQSVAGQVRAAAGVGTRGRVADAKVKPYLEGLARAALSRLVATPQRAESLLSLPDVAADPPPAPGSPAAAAAYMAGPLRPGQLLWAVQHTAARWRRWATSADFPPAEEDLSSSAAGGIYPANAAAWVAFATENYFGGAQPTAEQALEAYRLVWASQHGFEYHKSLLTALLRAGFDAARMRRAVEGCNLIDYVYSASTSSHTGGLLLDHEDYMHKLKCLIAQLRAQLAEVTAAGSGNTSRSGRPGRAAGSSGGADTATTLLSLSNVLAVAEGSTQLGHITAGLDKSADVQSATAVVYDTRLQEALVVRGFALDALVLRILGEEYQAWDMAHLTCPARVQRMQALHALLRSLVLPHLNNPRLAAKFASRTSKVMGATTDLIFSMMANIEALLQLLLAVPAAACLAVLRALSTDDCENEFSIIVRGIGYKPRLWDLLGYLSRVDFLTDLRRSYPEHGIVVPGSSKAHYTHHHAVQQRDRSWNDGAWLRAASLLGADDTGGAAPAAAAGARAEAGDGAEEEANKRYTDFLGSIVDRARGRLGLNRDPSIRSHHSNFKW